MRVIRSFRKSVMEGENKKAEGEKQQAQDVRLKAMETMGETRNSSRKQERNLS